MTTVNMKAFSDELQKIAALSEKEREIFGQAVKNHTEYDRKSGANKLSDADKNDMRHNVERINHFKKKKHDSSYKIPSWAQDHKGRPPAGSEFRRPPPPGSRRHHGSAGRGYSVDDIGSAVGKGVRKAYDAVKKSPSAKAGLAGFGVGAVGGAVAHHYATKKPPVTGKQRKHAEVTTAAFFDELQSITQS